MDATTSSDPIRLELYVRSLSPLGARTRQEAVIERLQRLEEVGRVDDIHVQVWGRRVDPSSTAAETDQGTFILNRIAEFKQWALANNVTLESFYQTRQQSSSVVGDDYTTIVLPKMGLAEYRGGELEQVVPCTGPDGVESVADYLDDLERRIAGRSTDRQEATVTEE